MVIKQSNGVEIRIQPVEGGDILFDIWSTDPTHPRVGSMRDEKFYQNLTIEDAKDIRKALKAAIKGATA